MKPCASRCLERRILIDMALGCGSFNRRSKFRGYSVSVTHRWLHPEGFVEAGDAGKGKILSALLNNT